MDRAIGSLAESFALAILWTHAEAGRARFYVKSRWTETGNHRQETTWEGLVFPAVEYSESSYLGDELAATRFVTWPSGGWPH